MAGPTPGDPVVGTDPFLGVSVTRSGRSLDARGKPAPQTTPLKVARALVTAALGADPAVMAHNLAHPIATMQAIHRTRGVQPEMLPFSGPVGELLAERMATAAARNQLRIPDLFPARASGPGKTAAEGLLKHVVDVRRYGHNPFVNHNDANAYATADLQHLIEAATSTNSQSALYGISQGRLAALRRAAAFVDKHMEQAAQIHSRHTGSLPTADQLPPWERTLGEFMYSPHTVWHGTRTAPGLGAVMDALHAGTFNAAAERAAIPFARGKETAMRFLPGWLVAKDAQIMPIEASDPGSSFAHRTGSEVPFRAENPQTMVMHRRVVRQQPGVRLTPEQISDRHAPQFRQYDLIPYNNTVEDAGNTSFQTTRRGVFKTHADFIKEALASGLDVSKALSSYSNPAAVRKSLLMQLAKERVSGLRRG